MIYEEFALEREIPRIRVDWDGELAEMRQAALNSAGLMLTVTGYLWLILAGLMQHPDFSWVPLSLPGGLGLLGMLVLIVRRPLRLRGALFVVGGLAVGGMGLFVQQSLSAPFFYLMVIVASTLAAGPMVPFAVAGASSVVLLMATAALPGQWPADLVSGALRSYWFAAGAAWITSRNLYTALAWALKGYESGWQTMRELQAERGKLNRTMKALSDANGLLKRTTYDLAEAREEAEKARQLKGQFAANISHELRTPLHLIVGFSQMMYTAPETYEGVRWTPDLRGDIQEIYESAQHLLRLIDDVLDLSQIEAARLPISKERISLAPLIRDTVDTARNLLRGRGLYLQVDLPTQLPSLHADPTRIRQVLLNLLNNASRFTDTGGITVRARAHPDDLEVIVEDTGVGIPTEQLQDIFGEFHQVDSSLRRRYGGTGLGLSICRQFVGLHDGRIWAESRQGEGSAFHFTLPLPSKTVVPRQASRLPAGWRYPAGKPAVPQKLVTLADPPEFPKLLSRHLPGAQVLEVRTLEEAARTARIRQADAVVLPTGVCLDDQADDLATAIGDLSLPIVTFSLPLEEHLALAEGFSHCLMKPFSAEGLLRTLEEAAPGARKVLAVDDDPGVVRLVERYLRRAEHPVQVLAAYDGEEAIGLLDEEPDLVLLDLILPGINGLGVLRALRDHPRCREVPAVAITAYSFARDVASLGRGFMSVRRGEHFSAAEMARWLETVIQSLPARHLTPGGLEAGSDG